MANLCNKNVPCGTKPVFILGPTGSGKSAVAVELAEILGNAEIISADAYQVYKGMPIITAAPTPLPWILPECAEQSAKKQVILKNQ